MGEIILGSHLCPDLSHKCCKELREGCFVSNCQEFFSYYVKPYATIDQASDSVFSQSNVTTVSLNRYNITNATQGNAGNTQRQQTNKQTIHFTVYECCNSPRAKKCKNYQKNATTRRNNYHGVIGFCPLMSISVHLCPLESTCFLLCPCMLKSVHKCPFVPINFL